MQAEGDILQQLNHHSAHSAHDQRSERGVGGDADHRLDAGAYLALEQDALEPDADRVHTPVQGDRGARHLDCGVESHDHAADVALVHQVARDHLGDQRIA